MKHFFYSMIIGIMIGLLCLTGCSGPSLYANNYQDNAGNLIYMYSEPLDYAQHFTIDYYDDGYTMIHIKNEHSILIVPEGHLIPDELPSETIVLQQPLTNIYLVASAAMDMFASLDALDQIGFSGQKKENWHIQKAKDAMEKGQIKYAGKYNQPDYELIFSEGCQLAIENTMIKHSPVVIEKLNEFDIPVMIDHSSDEDHPLGRVEWIKLYGILTGKIDLAQQLFDEQKKLMQDLTKTTPKDTTVAYFYLTTNGLVQVRQPDDYIPKMIELVGGKYILSGLITSESNRSTMNMQLETFYTMAKDADYIIYNSAIDGGIHSIDELIDKCALLQDFKAVKNNQVYCTTNDMYQQSMAIGHVMNDFYQIIHQVKPQNMEYIYKVEWE